MTFTLRHDKYGLPRVRADRAHRRLADFLETDVQENESLARELLQDLAAVEQKPAESLEVIGNAYVLTMAADGVTISDLYDDSSAPYRTDPDHFRRALTQWLAFITDS